MIAWAHRWQIPVYLMGIVVGASIGLLAPNGAPVFEALVTPALIALLFATFLAVPFAEIGRGIRDGRFLAAVVLLNFVVVPVVVFALSRFVAHDRALLVGVLLVLLTPCIDYVIVFTRLAGGAASKLLAVSPLLLLLQLALLPAFLGLLAGPDILRVLDIAPFVRAFLLFLALPLGLAALTQLLARRSTIARGIGRPMDAGMVPITAVTLAIVVAAQIDVVRAEVPTLLTVVPIYVAFLLIAATLGFLVARTFRQDVASTRAIVFSGATRNSLVILPLALALPAPLALAPAAVVMQTLVELVGMIVLVHVLPLRDRRAGHLRGPRETL